ncbi:MAG: hypothetical protein PHN19_05035 [Patescibacteria group bacterium]|nr:hypothetical protein [Patescibacteria group bacterium]
MGEGLFTGTRDEVIQRVMMSRWEDLVWRIKSDCETASKCKKAIQIISAKIVDPDAYLLGARNLELHLVPTEGSFQYRLAVVDLRMDLSVLNDVAPELVLRWINKCERINLRFVAKNVLDAIGL